MVLRRRKWASAEGERICTSTECEHKEELQPARSFYLRKNGTLDAICKDCRKSRSKVRYAQQQARIAAQQRDYRGSPKVRRRAYDRAHRKEYHTQRYVEKREEILAKAKAYRESNPQVGRWAGIRRLMRMLQNGGSHTHEQWLAVVHEQQGRCIYCNIPCMGAFRTPTAPTKDHVVPVSSGGSNDISNIVLACYECNVKKGSKQVWIPKGKAAE